MFIITVANEKGGVAKTTTSVNLAAAMAQKGLRVLMLDLDAQGSTATSLGLVIDPQRKSAGDIFVNNMPISEIILKDVVLSGLDLIPAGRNLTRAERTLPSNSSGEIVLRNALNQLNDSYDFMIIDSPGYLGVITVNALVAAQLLLIPILPEYLSVHPVGSLLELTRKVRERYNALLSYRLFFTMFQRHNRMHNVISEKFRASFKNGLLETVIETDTKVRESSLMGLPVICYAPQSRAAMQYSALAEEIIRHADQKNARSPR